MLPKLFLITDPSQEPNKIVQCVRLLQENNLGSKVAILWRDYRFFPDSVFAKELSFLCKEACVLFGSARSTSNVRSDFCHLSSRKQKNSSLHQQLLKVKLRTYAVHSVQELSFAIKNRASGVVFSPVFSVALKTPKGLTWLRTMSEKTPFFVKTWALGGVNEENCSTVLSHGVYGVAMQRGVFTSNDSFGVCMRLFKILYRS